jgi:phage antirepressor YoqD-like protein
MSTFFIPHQEIEFPERKFVKLLLNRGFLYRSPSGTLLPYAVEKNNDLFIVKDYFNNGHLGSQTLVTPKGKEFFKALCAEEE